MDQMPVPTSVANNSEVDFNLEDLSPEDLQKLVDLGVIDDNMLENARQMKLAEQLRYQAAPEGRQAGRTYVAASPLEHIGAGMEKYAAMKRMKELETARAGMGQQQTAGRSTYWDVLRGKKRGWTPEMQTPDFSGIQPPQVDLGE
jgi:hypothetical protein